MNNSYVSYVCINFTYYEYWNHIETQDAVLPKHLSKPHHLSRDSIPLPKNYTARSHLKKNLVRGSLQVRFAELIILLRFVSSWLSAINMSVVFIKTILLWGTKTTTWWTWLVKEEMVQFSSFQASDCSTCLPMCVYIVWSFCCFCVCCVYSWLMNLFLGGLETEMQHERMEWKTEPFSKICPETGDGIEVQHKISEQYYACKVLHKAVSEYASTDQCPHWVWWVLEVFLQSVEVCFTTKNAPNSHLGANPAIPYLKHKIIKNLWPIGSAASDALIRSKDPAYIARLVFCPDPRSIFIETYRFHRFCTAWVPNQ